AMDARAERIRRLRRAAAAWWVWTFIVALGTLLIAGSVTQLRGPMRPRSILVHLDSRDGGGWRATVLDADTFTPNADISDCSASGYYIVIPDRGSRSSNGLGFWRRSF